MPSPLAHLLLETLHRLMLLEAISRGLLTTGQPAKKLKQRLDIIPLLSDYNRCVAEIRRLRVRVYPVTFKHIRASHALRAAYGLMTKDSVVAALMLNYQISNLASRDSDLQRVPSLTLSQPTDINP